MTEQETAIDRAVAESGFDRLEAYVQLKEERDPVSGQVYVLNGEASDPVTFEGLDHLVMALDGLYKRAVGTNRTGAFSRCKEGKPGGKGVYVNVLHREGWTLQGELWSVTGRKYFRSALELIYLLRELLGEGSMRING